MKLSSYVFVFLTICLLLFGSCSRNNIESSMLLGTWRLSKVQFDEVASTEINNWNDWISGNTILNLGEGQSYYRNYVSGTWVLSDNQLLLTPRNNLQMDSKMYDVISVTDSVLTLQIHTTDRLYCCNFEEFEDEQILQITEVFIRE